MRNLLRSVRLSTSRNARSLFLIALLVSITVLSRPIHCQTAAPQEKPMKHYALLFHSSRPLTPEEVKQRGVEIAAWVKQVTDMGVTLDPRALGELAAAFSPRGSDIVARNGSIDPTLSNIVFFDSPSRDQAVEIARTHPGLHYGVSVEVREWTSPRPVAASQTGASQSGARP